jgi:hypothetical protein
MMAAGRCSVVNELNLKPIMSICLQNAVYQEICCGYIYCRSVGVRELSLERRGVHDKKKFENRCPNVSKRFTSFQSVGPSIGIES